ncbi:MAG TPA: PilZ domain-containing protein [Candidatus Acidoferrales bacterium]|nr:PilZ domain-containing protein [Candidatus Acidoferrales bacterium]
MTLPNPTGSDPLHPDSSPHSAQSGRRRFERTPCRIPAKIRIAEEDVIVPGTVTDVSPAGCYIEMLAPLPADTKVELTLSSGASNLFCTGVVRSTLSGMGMGVAFDSMNASQLEKLRTIVPEIPVIPAAADPLQKAPTPPASTRPLAMTSRAPHAHTNVAEVLEAIVRLLLKKGLLTRAELAEEIEKGKSGKH